MAKKAAKKSAKTARKSTAKKSPARKAAKKKSARKPNAAFMAPVTPSASLAEVVGSKPIPRTEVTKRLWVYIKKNKLQDATNRRMIKADAALKPVFGGKSTVNMFEMTKLVNKHLAK
jgi:upstream activation factor subunit UAF30